MTREEYIEAFVATLEEMMPYIEQRLGEKLVAQHILLGELTITVQPQDILDVVRVLHDDEQLQFICFIDICAVDWPAREQRFDVVYHLLSPRQNARVRIKVHVDEGRPVPSVTGIFPAAEWFEREAYDMYGVLFSGHPDLRRILTDYGFEGHPFRKDFPLTGYTEVRYSEEQKRVIYEPVELPQEYRSFDFLSPWEGTEYELPGDEKAKPN